MARAQVEQQPAATGTTLVVMVGLSIAFLLFMGFLNVVKSGNLVTESNFLYAAFIFYAGAGALYLGFGVTGIDSYVRFASLATWAGLAANTLAVAHRWYAAGHPPFASIYEMLLSFVWTLVVLTLIAEKKFGVKVIGTVTMPARIVPKKAASASYRFNERIPTRSPRRRPMRSRPRATASHSASKSR